MRRLVVRCLMALCAVGAWLALATALPGIWLAGFLRGCAIGLHPDPEDEAPSRKPSDHRRAVLTEADAALLFGTHESALRRGEARWQ